MTDERRTIGTGGQAGRGNVKLPLLALPATLHEGFCW